MSITVTGRKMPVTDALREYAEEKIGNSMKVMDIDPLVAEVVLFVDMPANASPKKKPASVCQNSKNASYAPVFATMRATTAASSMAPAALVDEWVNWMSFLYRA